MDYITMMEDANIFQKIEDIKAILEKKLSNNRFIHSINVMETAIKLSRNLNINFESLVLAGLLHDVGKSYSYIESSDIIENNNLCLDKVEKSNPNLIHAKIGAFIAQKEFKIEDEDVLNAIKYHTTGRRGMSLLEKVIYLSDYIEPGRSFKRVEEIWEIAYIDIDNAMIMALDDTITYVLGAELRLHNDTIEAREDILEQINKRDG